MKKYLASVVISSAILLASALSGAAGASVVVDRVVAVVNDDIITLSDLQRELLKRNEGGLPERLVLEDMINRKLQMTAAKRAGMDVTDKELAEAVADIMNRNKLDAKQFEAALAKEGLTLEQYRAELREQMTLSRVFNKYVRSGLAVDEKEVRAYYDRNLKEFSLPEEVRVRHLFLKLPEKSTTAQATALRERAETLYRRVSAGSDFVQLIREHSDGPTARQDGDLGFLQRGHAIPEIEEAARTLKPGQFAGPIQTADGFHIIRVEEIRTPVKPFEQVKEEIMRSLYEQQMENTYRTFLQTLRSDSHIENRL
jgi:peptidyl-prolyl cis-trans isomerase SurA